MEDLARIISTHAPAGGATLHLVLSSRFSHADGQFQTNSECSVHKLFIKVLFFSANPPGFYILLTVRRHFSRISSYLVIL